jgi:hypothetical protein
LTKQRLGRVRRNVSIRTMPRPGVTLKTSCADRWLRAILRRGNGNGRASERLVWCEYQIYFAGRRFVALGIPKCNGNGSGHGFTTTSRICREQRECKMKAIEPVVHLKLSIVAMPTLAQGQHRFNTNTGLLERSHTNFPFLTDAVLLGYHLQIFEPVRQNPCRCSRFCS